MAEKFTLAGIPSVPSKNGYSTDEGKALIGVSDQSITLGSVISNALRLTTDPVKIIIDAYNLKAFVSTGSEFKDAFTAEAGNLSNVVFTPTANQEGRSLEWGAALTGEVGAQRTAIQAAATIVDPVVPKMSVESLVARALAMVDKQEGVFVEIDQAAGTVTLIKAETGGEGSLAMAGTAPAGTRAAIVALEPVVVDNNATALKFEGGAV